jgi:hypothetical protein
MMRDLGALTNDSMSGEVLAFLEFVNRAAIGALGLTGARHV